MRNEIFSSPAGVILVTIGILISGYAAVISLISNMNMGIIVTFLLGVFLIAVGKLWKKLPKSVKSIFFVGMLIVLLCISLLIVYGITDDVTYDEDAVIVLGCGLRGERVSLTLKNRLNTAFEYYTQNPDAVIVLTGGQGPQENIPEAVAMERYMLNRGVPQEKLIREEKSTSTFENFTFSKNILDGYFSEPYKAVFVTDEYHIYRAENIAEKAGYENISHLNSNTVWYMLLPSCLRECMAVVKFWILGS